MMHYLLDLARISILSPLVAVVGATGLVGGILIALAFLAPAWLTKIVDTTHVMWLGVALVGCGAFYWWAFHAGEHHMAQLVAARDAAAVRRVEGARSRVHDCESRGGTWDVSVGSCSI